MRTHSARRAALGAPLWGLLFACAGCVLGAARPASAGLVPEQGSDRQRAEQRLHNLHLRLHPLARALVLAQGAEAAWARGAALSLPRESCAATLHVRVAAQLGCSLVALDGGALAVLTLQPANACAEAACVERSWVFLSAYARPLPLPARRTADYQHLRAELSREDATALWLAGFRGAGDTRLAAAPAPRHAGELPPLADYRSCTLAPAGRELICRATGGDVIGLDPLRGAQRLIARLGLPPAALAGTAADSGLSRPVRFTRAGELVIQLHARQHALCGGGPCELLGFSSLSHASPVQVRWTRR